MASCIYPVLSVVVLVACVANAAPLFLNGTLKATFVIEETPAAPMMTPDGHVVFGVVRGNPDLTRLENESPRQYTTNETDVTPKPPLCDIDPILPAPRPVGRHMRYPNTINPVRCGQCDDDDCPGGTTWSPVYVTMPVFTAMYQANDDPDDLYYVMDMRTIPVTCTCQRI